MAETAAAQVSDLESLAKDMQFGRAWIGLSVASKQAAKYLLRQQEEVFQQWAALYGVEEFRLSLPDGSYMSVPSGLSAIAGSMSVISSDSLKNLYIAPMPISKEMLQVMQRLIESDRPMFLLTNDSDHQIWLNQHGCDMIQSAGEEAVRRCMRNYWEGSDLEALHKKLRNTAQPFEHSYRAILNDRHRNTWFAATNRYEPIELNGRSYRLSINQSFEVIGKTSLQPALS